MATERLSMRRRREILRQKWELGRSHREVAQSVGASAGAVGETVQRAKAAGLRLGGGRGAGDEALEQRLYPPVAAAAKPTAGLRVDPPERRRVGRDAAAAAPRVPGAAARRVPLHAVLRALPPVARQAAARRCGRCTTAGEKLFVDYSGKKPRIVDRRRRASGSRSSSSSRCSARRTSRTRRRR